MKRLLLFLSLALLCLPCFSWLDVGDYVYTRNGRFVTTGHNLVDNYDFANGLVGWTNAYGDTLSVDTVELVTGDGKGPDGRSYIRVIVGQDSLIQNKVSGDKVSHLKVSVLLPRRDTRYIVTYKMKSRSENLAKPKRTAGNILVTKNFQEVYTNSDGSMKMDTRIADYVRYDSCWTEVVYDLLPGNGSTDSLFVNILLYNMVEGDCFADFGVYPAAQVADDRMVRDALEQIDFYRRNEEDFPNERWVLDDATYMLNDILARPTASQGELSEVLELLFGGDGNTAMRQFLDANTLDMSQYYKNFTFDSVPAGTEIADGWTIGGCGHDGCFYEGRWFVSPPECCMGSNHVSMVPPYFREDLPAGTYMQASDLPGGKYLYVVKARANRYFHGEDPVNMVPDYQTLIQGCKFFIESDTVTMDSVPTWRGRTFMLMAACDDGVKTIGFHVPGVQRNEYNIEGRICFDNMELRLIGGKREDVDAYFFRVLMSAARDTLVALLDSARIAADSHAYLYGKEVLRGSIAVAERTLAETEDYVKASLDAIEAQTAAMRGAISVYYEVNAGYTALAGITDEAEKAYADSRYTSGKAALREVLNTAKDFYESLTAEDYDVNGMRTQHDAVSAVLERYYAANAGYDTPCNIRIVNPYFADGADGWTVTYAEDKYDRLKFGPDSTFTGGTKAYVYHGMNAAPKNKVVQTVTLEDNGLYELSFEAYAFCEGGYDGSITDDVKVWFVTRLGDGRVDSLMIHTSAPVKAERYTKRIFVDTAPVELTFGIDALRNYSHFEQEWDAAGLTYATCYGYGGNEITFYGDYAKYVSDSVAAAIVPVRDSLRRAVDDAWGLLSEARNPAGVSTVPFSSALSDVSSVCDDSDATMEQLLSQFTVLESAVRDFMLSGVWPAAGKCYDLTFKIVNPGFSGPDCFSGWAHSGTEIGVSPGGYLSVYRSVDMTLAVTQTIAGLPVGRHQFLMNATYRYKKPSEEIFDSDNYGDNEWVFLVGNEDKSAVRGLLAEGAYDDSSGTWVFDDGCVMTASDYSHMPGAAALFDCGHYLGSVAFTVDFGGQATVGLSVEELPAMSFVAARGPQLLFWGDEVADGIGNVTAGNAGANAISGDVYTLSGVKVRSNATSLDGLGKGIYIVSGKKYVVR